MRLVSESARVGDPVRVTVAGVEVEGRIEAVEASTVRVRIGLATVLNNHRHACPARAIESTLIA